MSVHGQSSFVLIPSILPSIQLFFFGSSFRVPFGSFLGFSVEIFFLNFLHMSNSCHRSSSTTLSRICLHTFIVPLIMSFRNFYFSSFICTFYKKILKLLVLLDMYSYEKITISCDLRLLHHKTYALWNGCRNSFLYDVEGGSRSA